MFSDDATVEDKFTKAKLSLREEVPFFGYILYSLNSKPSNRPDVGAVDVEGNHFYNPDYFEDASLSETVFHLFHESNHVAKEQLFRRNGRDPELWNIAADLVVNADAHQLGLEVPDEFYFEPRFTDKSVEEVYLDLLEERDNEQEQQEQNQQDQQEEGEQGEEDSSTENDGDDGEKDQSDESGSSSSDSGDEGDESSSEDQEQGDEAEGEGDESGEESGESSGEGSSGESQTGDTGEPETGSGSDSGAGSQSQSGSSSPDTCPQNGEDESPREKATRRVVEKYGGGNPDNHQFEPIDVDEFTPSERQQARQELRRIVSRAVVYAKDQDSLPGRLKEELDELHNDTLDWYSRTEEFIQRAEASHWTWTRKPKSTWATGVRLPAVQKEKLWGAVMIDTSASMGREEVRDALSETQALLDCRPNTEILVLEHTTQVNRTYKLGSDTGLAEVNTEDLRRGGTSHLDVFRELENNPERFDFAVGFTDGYSSFPETPPNFQVLWIVPEQGAGRDQFSFGEVTYIPAP